MGLVSKERFHFFVVVFIVTSFIIKYYEILYAVNVSSYVILLLLHRLGFRQPHALFYINPSFLSKV